MLQPVDRRRSCPPRDDRTRLVLHDEYAFSAVYIETYIVALHWAVLRLWIGALCATTPRSAVDHTAVTRGTAQCLHRYAFVDGVGEKGRRRSPMPRTHPPYAPEYRRRIIALARWGRPIAQV